MEVDIDLLSPNEQQPRVQMDDARLEELAQSIKANGIIQPILVRRDRRPRIASSRASGDGALRSAQACSRCRSSFATSPIDADKQLLELALIENIQRENLNPVDEALAYQRLADEFASDAGSDRRGGRQGSQLGRELHAAAEAARGSARRPRGGRAVDGARARTARAVRCARRSGRRRAKSSRGRCRSAKPKRWSSGSRRRQAPRTRRHDADAPATDVHTRAAEDRLRFALGTKVRIVRRGQGGTIEIDFGSEAELNRIYEQITDVTSADGCHAVPRILAGLDRPCSVSVV